MFTLSRYNGNLVAMDMRSGQILWKRDFGSVNELVLDGESPLCCCRDDKRLWSACSRWRHHVVWDKLLRNLSAPEIFNGYLVIR